MDEPCRALPYLPFRRSPYDSVGRTTEITYAGGRAVACDYDTTGRLETVPGYLSGRVSYDAAGRVSSLTAANGVRTTAERDLLGRLKELDYSGPVDVASFSLSYDSAGNIVRKNDSSYTYDRNNRLEAANERGRFANNRIAEQDDLGKREGDTDGEGELTFTSEQTEVLFDYGSMSIGVDLGNTFEVSRVTLDPRATGHRVKAERYEILVAAYNAEGNWTKVQGAVAEVLPSGAILTRFKEPVEARYIKLHCYYDDLGADGKPVDKATVRNPLVTVGYFERNRDEDYEYDAKGNRKRVTTVFAGNTTSSSYTYYPNTDRIRTDGKYAYVYDPNGNMIEKGTAFEDTGSEIKFFDTEGEYFKYEYDLSNRLTRVLRSDAGTANAAVRSSYRYGPDGLRISKTTASGTTYYVYGLDGNELSEISDAGQTDTVWVLGKKFAEETTSGVTTTRTYLATDHLGSVVAATDETGQVIWQGSLTAFGEDGGEAGLKDRPRSYAGKDWDEDAGLVYNNARWYDPRIGRFTTEDPARDGVNWYAYVNNRPLNATDPTGLITNEDNGPFPGLSQGYGRESYLRQTYVDRTSGTPVLRNGSAIGNMPISEYQNEFSTNLKNMQNQLNDDISGALRTAGINPQYLSGAVKVSSGFYGSFGAIALAEVGHPVLGVAALYGSICTFVDGIVDLVSAPFGINPTDVGEGMISELSGANKAVSAAAGLTDLALNAFGDIAMGEDFIGGVGGSLFTGALTDTFDTINPNPSSYANYVPPATQTKESPTNESDSSNSDSKIICAELHRQGLMDSDIYIADEEFGSRMGFNHPLIMKGYTFWAKPIVKRMRLSSSFTKTVESVVRPWSYEMAYKMKARDQGNTLGLIIMIIGIIICGITGLFLSINFIILFVSVLLVVVICKRKRIMFFLNQKIKNHGNY